MKGKKRLGENFRNNHEASNEMAMNTYLSVITFNVNGLNAPIKRYRVSEWIKKQDTLICCLHETHFRPKDTSRFKVRGRKLMYHTNGHQKKAGQSLYQIN